MLNPISDTLIDTDPLESSEWEAALDNVVAEVGQSRASYLLNRLNQRLENKGLAISQGFNPNYVNTIRAEEQPEYPGNLELEREIRNINRWNAAAMVVNAGHIDSTLGGHLATYASSACLYEVGFNHFFHGQSYKNGGDCVYFQGHASPGIYARSYLEGFFSDEQLAHFRREVIGSGLSSYPHPYTMPDYWQFATVSMGLGPLQGIYQAKFLKYIHNRGIQDTDGRKVWVFCGDGEMDEPESMGAISIAAREKLDNLIFVVNCNLQKLDGPVTGNDRVVDLLANSFHGAGWNVIKVLWGSGWDPIFANDSEGVLTHVLNHTVDGEFQNYRSNGGDYIREHFFGKDPKLKQLISSYSDEEILSLKRGGHDPAKVYAAYHRAVNTNNGKPTVILAKTVKGFGLIDIQGSNNAHNIKKMTDEQLLHYRDSLCLPLTDEQTIACQFYRPEPDSEVMQYLHQRRQSLQGYIPRRRQTTDTALQVPELTDKIFAAHLKGTDDREISSNMAYAKIFTSLLRDKQIGPRLVPIVPDECRTLAMEGLFPKIGLYSVVGQKYDPVDSGQLIYYKESQQGQILNEGLTEDGATCELIAAGTSYSTNNTPMIPMYLYYSMFGFQRTGDLAWAAGDMRTRGFFIGSLSGRTSLPGEGTQHCDGQSQILASTFPSMKSYDPSFGYEIAVIMRQGMHEMLTLQHDVMYYITVMNEKYSHPNMPTGVESDILKGLYQFKTHKPNKQQPQVQLLSCGSIMLETIAAGQLLINDFGVAPTIWSAVSFNELRRDGLAVQHWNIHNPSQKPKTAFVSDKLLPTQGPIVAATDYMKIYPEQIREFLPGKIFKVLGTDGYGRSDSRSTLRRFYEVDRGYIAYMAVLALVEQGQLDSKAIKQAQKLYEIDKNKVNPAI